MFFLACGTILKKCRWAPHFEGKSFFAPSCRMPSILRTIVHCAIVSLREINSFLCSKISHNRDFVRFVFESPRILPRLLCQGDKAVCGWQAERFQFHAKNPCRKFEQRAKSEIVSMRWNACNICLRLTFLRFFQNDIGGWSWKVENICYCITSFGVWGLYIKDLVVFNI